MVLRCYRFVSFLKYSLKLGLVVFEIPVIDFLKNFGYLLSCIYHQWRSNHEKLYRGNQNEDRQSMEKKIRSITDENIHNTKINLRRTQSYGVSKLIQKQIETDKWLRVTAAKINEKTAVIQQKILALSDYWMTISIENYNDLNAKNAAKAVRQLGLKKISLHIQYHEQKNKNRKTVLQSIDYRLEKYNQGLVE